MTEIATQNIAQRPVGQLATNRKLWKYVLFSILTLGIYGIVFYSKLSADVDIVCNRYDGRRTMPYCLLYFLVGIVTFGIAYFVWFNKISNRIGAELERRGIDYSFNAGKYWLWNVLGSFILVGPFIYLHKLSKAMNYMNADYNING